MLGLTADRNSQWRACEAHALFLEKRRMLNFNQVTDSLGGELQRSFLCRAWRTKRRGYRQGTTLQYAMVGCGEKCKRRKRYHSFFYLSFYIVFIHLRHSPIPSPLRHHVTTTGKGHAQPQRRCHLITWVPSDDARVDAWPPPPAPPCSSPSPVSTKRIVPADGSVSTQAPVSPVVAYVGSSPLHA